MSPRIPLVPPGLGKPSTHSRNKRRRLKRGYGGKVMSTALSADIPGPPKGSSHTNKVPLGQRKSEPGPSNYPPDHTNLLLSVQPPAQPSPDSPSPTYHLTQRDREGPASDVASALNNAFETNAQGGDISGNLLSGMNPKHSRNEDTSDSYITPNQVMMGSLRNKNKKKGFKQSMAGPIPQKIIFTATQQSSSTTQGMLVDEPSTSFGTIQPRLIPPSEIQELGQLPSNMFVTSVDVESDMWNEYPLSPKKKDKKKKAINGGHHPVTTTDWHDPSQGIPSEVGENGQFDDVDDGSMTLPYFDTDIQTTPQAPSTGTTSGATRPFDWDRAERLWKECAVLEKLEQLALGCLVGWKVCNRGSFLVYEICSSYVYEQGLAINPQTSSPEILLTVARVVNICQGSVPIIVNGTQAIVVQYLRRPGTGRAALAFGLNGAAGFNDEEQVEDEEETIEWTELLAKQWRLIKL